MNPTKRYRHASATVEAAQFRADLTHHEATAIYQWIADAIGAFDYFDDTPDVGVAINRLNGSLVLATHDGRRSIDLDNWVVRNPDGQFHSVTPDEFEKNFSPLDDGAP